ncbi:MAG: cytochrome b N-terminal domain-containing protein [Acidimicrobiales bacterium]
MTPLARAQRILLGVVVAMGAVLAVTGVWLTFNYRPNAAQAWPDLGSSPAATDWPRLIHQVASVLLLPVVVAFLVVGVVASRRWHSATALLVTTLTLAYTGTLLPWDQLALWAVTVGTNHQGMLAAAFSNDVRFVILGGAEISQATLALWLVVHAAVLPVVFAGLLALAARGMWARRPRTDAYAEPPGTSSATPPTSSSRWSNQSRTMRS